MTQFDSSTLQTAAPVQTPAKAGPVELSADLLQHVSGAGPRGGWSEASATPLDAGPRGGW